MGEIHKTQKSKVTSKKSAKNADSLVSPKKLNKQQELFCREVAKGSNLTQAAIKAKYSPKTARQIGSKLLTNVDISARIEQEAQKLQEKNDYKVAKHAEELDEAKELARKLGNASAFLNAIVQKGKLFGLYIEKVESNQTVTIKDDWRQIAADLGISNGG